MTVHRFTVKTYDDLLALPTGTLFAINLPKTMSWRDRHGIFYRTANREVTLVLRDGSKVTGRLDETPGYFSRNTKRGPRLWLYVEGRKSRKGIDIHDVKRLEGYKAPTLAEAVGAYIVLNASNPTDQQVAEARLVAAQM
jgi:hypothetical protein